MTVLAYGTMVHVALAAAEETGVDAEVIDLRTLVPLDIETIVASVKKTGRCVIVHEATRTCGFGAELVGAGAGALLLSSGSADRAGDRLGHALSARLRMGLFPRARRASPRRCASAYGGAEHGPATSSSCPTSAKASPRPRSSPGTSRSATSSRKTSTARRRDDRQGDGRDDLAGRRQGRRAGGEPGDDARGRLGAGRARGRRAPAMPPGRSASAKPAPPAPHRKPAERPSADRAAPRRAAAPRLTRAAAPRARRAGRRRRAAPGDKPLASPAVRQRARDARHRPAPRARARAQAAASATDLDAYLARPAAGPAAHGAGQAAATGGRDDQGHRPAPPIAEQHAESDAPHPAFRLCRGNRRHRAGGAARHLNAQRAEERPQLTLLPFLMRAMVKALADYPADQRALRRRGGVVTAIGAVHIGIATQTADRADGAGGAPRRGARPVGLRARDRRRRRRGARRARRRARSCPARPSPSPASARSAASPRRRSSTIRKWRSSAPTRSSSGRSCATASFVLRKMMNLSSSFDHRVVDGYDAAPSSSESRRCWSMPATLFIDERWPNERAARKVLIVGGGPGGYVAAIRAASSASTRCWSRRPASAAPASYRLHSLQGDHPCRRAVHALTEPQAPNAIGITLGAARARLRQDRRLEGRDRRRASNTGVAALLKRRQGAVVEGWATFIDGKTASSKPTPASSASPPSTSSSPPARSRWRCRPAVRRQRHLLDRGAVADQGSARRSPSSAPAISGWSSASPSASSARSHHRRGAAEDPAALRRGADPAGARRLADHGVETHLGARALGFAEGRARGRGRGRRETRARGRQDPGHGRPPRRARRAGAWKALDLDMAGPFVRIDDRCRPRCAMSGRSATWSASRCWRNAPWRRARWSPRSSPASSAASIPSRRGDLLHRAGDRRGRALAGRGKAAHGEIIVGQFPFRANGRAMTKQADEGFVRVVARADITRARHSGGRRGISELRPAFRSALEMGALLEDIAGTIHAHPTLGEAFHEAALKALGKPLHM